MFDAPPYQILRDGGTVHMVHPRDDAWVKANWQTVERLLCQDDRWWKTERTLADYHERFRSGRMSLWALEDSARDLKGVMFMHFANWPTGMRSVHSTMIAGEGWLEAFGQITCTLEWARLNGAMLSVMGGRPGWERALKPMGFGDPRTYVRRDISQPLEARQ